MIIAHVVHLFNFFFFFPVFKRSLIFDLNNFPVYVVELVYGQWHPVLRTRYNVAIAVSQVCQNRCCHCHTIDCILMVYHLLRCLHQWLYCQVIHKIQLLVLVGKNKKNKKLLINFIIWFYQIFQSYFERSVLLFSLLLCSIVSFSYWFERFAFVTIFQLCQYRFQSIIFSELCVEFKVDLFLNFIIILQ